MKTLKQKKYWVEHFNDEKYVKLRTEIINSFKDLVFDEGPHKYYLHGKEITCVSNVTHMFKPHFDTDDMAQQTYERNYNNERSKYYKMTPEMIKEEWSKISKEACSHGTERHEFAESIFYFMTNQFDKILEPFKDRLSYDENNEPIFIAKEPKEEAAVTFYEELPDSLFPILAETKVYNEKLGYSGTFDLLMYYDATIDGKDDKNSGLCVMDWKTNKDLYKNFKDERLLPPFEGLQDMPLSIYKLQLSLYQICLEKIGLKTIARRIMWLLPNGTYDKIPLESYTKQLEEELIKHPIMLN